MKKCKKCGKEYLSDYEFCPECGSRFDEEEHQVVEQPEQDYQYTYSYAQQPSSQAKTKKKISKKAKIIFCCVAAAAVILIIAFIGIMSPKELSINGNETIEIYVGDTETVSVSGDGLTEADYQTVLWTSDNTDVIKVDSGELEAFYDSDSFHEYSEDESDQDMNPCECNTYINASIERGLRTWEGRVKVKVSLKPVDVESGKVIKEPADSRASSLTVTPSDDYNTYIYLESKTKESNDMSFIIKKGEKTTVNVPRDKYIMYWANGDTWYGGEFLFGPQTSYQKDAEEWDFYNYTWTLELGALNGNMSGESVSEDDFPEL